MKILGSIVQTPNERKRYTFDYSRWLDDGEEITSANVEIDNATDDPLVVDGVITTSSTVTFFVSGGENEEMYRVGVVVETSHEQEKEDVLVFSIRDPLP